MQRLLMPDRSPLPSSSSTGEGHALLTLVHRFTTQPTPQLEEKLRTQEAKYKEEAAKYKAAWKAQGQMHGEARAAKAKQDVGGEMAYLKDQLQMKEQEVRGWVAVGCSALRSLAWRGVILTPARQRTWPHAGRQGAEREGGGAGGAQEGRGAAAEPGALHGGRGG